MSPISVYFIFHQKVIFFIFFLFAYLQSYIHKSFTNCPVKPQHVLYANQPFFRKMIVSFFSSNIPLYVEKNPVEKPCKVLEMELKTYTPFSLKFVFEKIKFKVLHYIQHDFISQRLGFSKDQTSMFKRLVIKVKLSSSKKDCLICFDKNPLKMMKRAFNFTLKALFFLKKINFCLLFLVMQKK